MVTHGTFPASTARLASRSSTNWDCFSVKSTLGIFPGLVIGIAILHDREDVFEFAGPVRELIFIINPNSSIRNGTRSMLRPQVSPIYETKLPANHPIADALE